jgi:hypothetical protein
MLRTVASMGAFVLVCLVGADHGLDWQTAAIRGLAAAIVFNFFAWAAGLYLFGELYDAEVKQARRKLEEKERERARRIEQYYRDRLRAQDAAAAGEADTVPGGVVPALSSVGGDAAPPPAYAEPQRYAA